jgi:hypothetical protein
MLNERLLLDKKQNNIMMYFLKNTSTVDWCEVRTPTFGFVEWNIENVIRSEQMTMNTYFMKNNLMKF